MDLRQFGKFSNFDRRIRWKMAPAPNWDTPFSSINLRTRSTLTKFPFSSSYRSKVAIFHVANKLTYLAHRASLLYFDVTRWPDRMILMAIRSSRISATFLINRDEIRCRAARTSAAGKTFELIYRSLPDRSIPRFKELKIFLLFYLESNILGIPNRSNYTFIMDLLRLIYLLVIRKM